MKQVDRDPRNREAVERTVPLAKVQKDRSTQARMRLEASHVDALTDALERVKEFNDLVELYDDGEGAFWVGDGFHRLAAYERAGRTKIKALVRKGTHRDAMIHAAGANSDHGRPRTRKDIWRAINLLLDDPELGKLSSRMLAAIVRCDGKTVDARREARGLDSTERVYEDRHGNRTVMNIEGLRRRHAVPGAEPVNAYHELPVSLRVPLKETLHELTRLTASEFAFAVTWLGKYTQNVKQKDVKTLLAEIEAEEQAAQDAASSLEVEADHDEIVTRRSG